MIVRQQIEKQHKTPLFSRSNSQISEHLDDFMLTSWVDSASESALEEVLTTYTKLHRSASIFLGSTAKVEPSPRPPHLPSHLRRVLKQPDSTPEQNENSTKKKSEDEQKHDENNFRIIRRFTILFVDIYSIKNCLKLIASYLRNCFENNNFF